MGCILYLNKVFLKKAQKSVIKKSNLSHIIQILKYENFGNLLHLNELLVLYSKLGPSQKIYAAIRSFHSVDVEM